MRQILKPFDIEKIKAGHTVTTHDRHHVVYLGENNTVTDPDIYPYLFAIRITEKDESRINEEEFEWIMDNEYSYMIVSVTEAGHYHMGKNKDWRDLYILEEAKPVPLQFDLEKAKAGAEIVTRDGKIVRLVGTFKSIRGEKLIVVMTDTEGYEHMSMYTSYGKPESARDGEKTDNDLLIMGYAEEDTDF